MKILVIRSLLLCLLFLGSSGRAQIPVTAWVQRFGGLADAPNETTKLAADASGNVVVAGHVDLGIQGKDWLIIKNSGAGVPLWTNLYNGPGNADDIPNAVALDGNGNVFVAGGSRSTNGFDDYATVKYSALGVPVWTNRYNGPGNRVDTASAVAVDANGNVYVTGVSDGIGSVKGYATVVYANDGLPLWTNRYSDPANSRASAAACAVDTNGNVFVTGSATAGSHADYVTIKYSSAGTGLWTNRYPGSGNSGGAAAVAVDNGGNVFVTGSIASSGVASDYATLAYSNAGIPLWTNRYHGAGSGQDAAVGLTLDGGGNVIVTGTSTGANGAAGYATLAYSGVGVALWTNRFEGPGNDDQASAVAVDGGGNVFVTGLSLSLGGPYPYNYATLKYSSSGIPLWTNRYSAPGSSNAFASAIAVAGNGEVFVTGRSASGFGLAQGTTIGYSSAGEGIWTNVYRPVGLGSAEGSASVVDGGGNVIVTGKSSVPGGTYDYITIAYSSAGVSLWSNRYNGPANGNDAAAAIAVDGSGNVFVTGTSAGIGTSGDYATIAYSSAGAGLWTNRYDGPGNGDDHAQAIAVDGSGNVFVTGYSPGSNGNWDFATIAYSNAGVPLWTNRYDGDGNGDDSANAMVVAPGGNVIVTGYSAGIGSSYEYATIAYSGAGIGLWTNRYNGPGNSDDSANGVAVDSAGNVLVTGYSWGGSSSYDYATIKYSGSGGGLWTNRYALAGNHDDEAYAVAVDGGGNVFVTGFSATVSGGRDYVTIKYSSGGAGLWTNRYTGDETAFAIAVDHDGNAFITGHSVNANETTDITTLVYSGTGVALWTNRYDGPAHGSDDPGGKQSLALGPDGGVYLVGRSDGEFGSRTRFDFVTIKYAVPPLLINTSDGNFGLSNGNFGFTFSGAPGQKAVVESSSNLLNWTPLKTNTLGIAPVYFQETPGAGIPSRFYRIRAQ